MPFRLFLMAALWLLCAISSGCAAVPPAPAAGPSAPSAQNQKLENDPYDGWLFKKLTGQDKTAQASAPSSATAAVAPAAAAGTGVVQASATQYMPGAPNPVTAPGGAATVAGAGTAVTAAAAASPAIYPPPAPAVVDSAPKKKGPDFELEDLAPEKVYKGMKTMVGLGPNEQIARTAFDEGKALFAQKKYSEAAPKFKLAADRWPDSKMEEDAMFMLAESYYFGDNYAGAHDEYGMLLKKFDNTIYLDTVMKREFALGRYWEQLHTKQQHWPVTPNFTDKAQPMFDTLGHALECYQRVQLHDPTGPLADDALMAEANAYFVMGRFEEAAYHYDQLRKEYPTSEFQVKAHELGLQAKLHVYQGPHYDGTQLKEADEIARQSLTQFGSELGAEKERIQQTSKEIKESQAQRQWEMAQFYEAKRAYGAARFYYNQIIKDFPLTAYAQRARLRLDEIREYPAEPPNYFKWLTDAFPGEK